MEKFFKMGARGTNVRREIVAGLTTFLAMAYILAVNPKMLANAGMDAGGVFTATALAACIATLVMAFTANLPIALAPGMGLNAFFAFTVVLGMGISWKIALTAVFLEGVLFIILSLFNVRERIIKAIPSNLKKAVAAGIGLFICFIGFQNAGIIVNNDATLVGLGNLTHGPAAVAMIGLALTAVLYALKIPGSILIGILVTTLIGIPFGVTSVPANWTPVSMPAAPLLFQFDFSHIFTLDFFAVFFTFLFVDIFDTVGTLVGVSSEAHIMDANGNVPRVKQALLSDAIGTVAGACLGTSTVTSYVESTAGAAGGRTGMTALTTGVLFLLALFLSPLFLLVPGAATAPALIIVGFLMLKAVTGINFNDVTEGLSAFITIVMMPFAYSIAEGIVWGIITYVFMKAATGKAKSIPVVTWVLFVIFILRLILTSGA
uniref:Putative integral membrane protein n=1 Tax=Treponema maltophilum TaxID=51160 RepID=Q8GBS5_TREMA|nr:putative integral membrane protein [Treponema maltophilum]